VNKNVNINNVYGPVNIYDSSEHKINAVINGLLTNLASSTFSLPLSDRKPSASTLIKINYNNLHSKKHIIKLYLDKSAVIEAAFEAIDSLIPFGKSVILQNLNNLYYEALDEHNIEYLGEKIDISLVQACGSSIIDSIILKLKKSIHESANPPDFIEQLDLGLKVIVAYAFIECVIMENPN